MIKLGLIGGTGPESTVEYYKGIVYGVQKKQNRPYFPNLTIESLSVFDVLRFCEEKNFAGLAAYLCRGVERLAAAGAQCAALTGITPHVVFDELAAASPIPLVSMVDTAREAACRCGYETVALLGTLPTMNGTFFQKSFAERGVNTVTPNDAEKRWIAEKIETELEFGRVLPQTQNEFLRIARRMAEEEGAQAVVLGCTELPLIFRGQTTQTPLLNVMRLHIDALVDLILNESIEKA